MTDSLVVPVLNDNLAGAVQDNPPKSFFRIFQQLQSLDFVEDFLLTGFVNERDKEAIFQPLNDITLGNTFSIDNISQQIAAYSVEQQPREQQELLSTSAKILDDDWKRSETIPDIRHLIPEGWHAYVRVSRILAKKITNMLFLHPYNLDFNDVKVKMSHSSLYDPLDQAEMQHGLKKFSKLIMSRMKQNLLPNQLLSYSPNEIVSTHTLPCNNDQPKKLIEDLSLKTCLLAFDIVLETPDGLYYPTGISCVSHEILECKQNE
ncbi:unnamed protein product [Didymodactylos carnosus]|uniref:Uncharacterized protein n=1 Tax=Didymodactylos carnosus TaxID=1234261 RepID=A0A815QKW6_9BILA|nr:unnamed protein product [Didymodactylos carnosus]CAF4334171.1 unnamed protein product [Didymodactylos carnosus]